MCDFFLWGNVLMFKTKFMFHHSQQIFQMTRKIDLQLQSTRWIVRCRGRFGEEFSYQRDVVRASGGDQIEHL